MEVLGLNFAVFNIQTEDRTMADAGFIRRWGKELFNKKIAPIHKTGIMSIFNIKPNKYTRWYVELVAFLVNARRCGDL